MSVVAIVGRPNVGKSTLFNRLTKSRRAIVSDEAGTTRDRQYGKCEWNGREFSVVDTGGWVVKSDDIFEEEIRKQVVIATEEADLVLFLVDITTGLTDWDEDVALILRRSKLPVIVVANKADNFDQYYEAAEFYKLGLGDPMCISSATGSGTGDLLDKVLENLKSETETAEGQIQVDQEMKKIDCMELMQTTLVKNLKDYTFKRGALPGKKSLKGCTVTDVDMSSITYLKKGSKKPVKLPWQTFLRDYHNNLDEIISAFIVKNGAAGGESKGRLSKKDRFNAITGVAFVLRIVCSDDPSSAGYAEKLLKDAVKDYGDYFKQTKEFFPDSDFSDVEAEVSANNT